MNAARSVTAHFIARYALTTSASPSGGGSVSGGGTYDAGTRRHGHGHGEQGLPLRPLVGGLHGHGNLLGDHERRALRDGALHAHLRPHHQRLAVRRRQRHGRGHAQLAGRERHGHGHAQQGESQQGLPLRPLVGGLHRLGGLLRDHERRPLRHRPFRAYLHHWRARPARSRGDGHRRGHVRRRHAHHHHRHAEARLPLRHLGGQGPLLRSHPDRVVVHLHGDRTALLHGPLPSRLHLDHDRGPVRRRHDHRRRHVLHSGTDVTVTANPNSGLPLRPLVGGTARDREPVPSP